MTEEIVETPKEIKLFDWSLPCTPDSLGFYMKKVTRELGPNSLAIYYLQALADREEAGWAYEFELDTEQVMRVLTAVHKGETYSL